MAFKRVNKGGRSHKSRHADISLILPTEEHSYAQNGASDNLSVDGIQESVGLVQLLDEDRPVPDCRCSKEAIEDSKRRSAPNSKPPPSSRSEQPCGKLKTKTRARGNAKAPATPKITLTPPEGFTLLPGRDSTNNFKETYDGHATMTEPRARAARHKGQMNFEAERTHVLPLTFIPNQLTPPVHQFLFAFGDDKNPLPETVRVLDEIVTDYIIETCHSAAKSAEVSNRSKIKVDDFKFAIRKDEQATGRVKELLTMDKVMKDSRKQFDTSDGRVGLERGGRKRKAEEMEVVKGGDVGEDDVDVDVDDVDVEAE